MELRADDAGFLEGSEPADLSAEQSQLQILRAIKADTAAMRAALGRSPGSQGGRPPAPPTPATLAQAARAAARQREAANGPVETPPERAARRRERQAGAADTDTPAGPNRGANGRFQSDAERNGSAGADGAGEGSGGREGGRMGKLMGKVGDMADKLRDGVSGLFAGSEQVDPALAAAKEVGDIVSPLTAPLKGLGSMLFGGGGDKADRERVENEIAVPWYRKLWNELRDLNEQPGGGGGGGGGRVTLGGLGGLLMKLPGIGLLGSLLGKLGGGLKPLLGVLGKAALPLAGIFSAFKSFSTSTEDYARRMGVELNGGLAQELGVRFVGVLGDFGNTLTFGLAGKFGEYIAPAVSKMVDGVIGAWDSTSQWVESKWSEAIGRFDGVIDGLAGLVDGARKWIDDKLGAVAKKAEALAAPVVERARAVREKALDARDETSSWISDKADTVASAMGGGSKGRKQALQAEMLRSGITDPREQAMLMAQMDHESGGFRATEESFNYRSADRLMAVSGTAKKKGSKAVEAAMAQGPEAVAELMYGGRMGNTEKGDAHKFRGRGAIQLTGKDNYAAASKDLGIDLMSNPGLAADPAVAAKVATWYWKKNNLGDAARKGDVTGVTKKINGGTNGLADRNAKYKAYLAAANAGKLSMGANGPSSKNVSPTAIPYAESKAKTPAGEPLDFQARADARAIAEASAPIVTSKATALNEGGLRAIERGAVRVAPSSRAKIATAPAIASVAPSADRQAVAPAPSAPRKLASNESKAPPPTLIEQPLTQNLGDRGLAQAATGGLGMNIGGR